MGDQGTNKVIRSVKEKSPSTNGWVAEVLGDMHARGNILIIPPSVFYPNVCKREFGYD